MASSLAITSSSLCAALRGLRGWRAASPSALAALVVSLAPNLSSATVSSVLPTPTMRVVAPTQATTVSVVWNVMRLPGNCGDTVSSSQGLVRANIGNLPILMTVPRALTQSQLCGNAPTPFTFSESVIIPADVVLRAQRLGASGLVFQRAFADIPPAVTGEVSLPISSAAAAGFGVTREALQFDNGAALRVLGRHEDLRALAEIAYSGGGLLQAMWELAEPASTSGEPIFRPLAQVREFVAPIGDKKVLKSPPLPTDAIGLYLVRLRITDPAPAFDAPVIRYFVGDGRPGRELPPRPLGVYEPPPSATLAPDTDFTWEPITGAKAYQVQIYRVASDGSTALPDLGYGETINRREIARALSRPPVTGMLVTAQQTRTPLSAAARAHLVPGQIYLWRVQALGDDGVAFAESQPRELRTP